MSEITDLDWVLALVKEKTAYPVSVTPSSSIQTHAAMKSATREVPVHTVLVNPKCDKFSSYLVAAQCAMLIIKWADPKRIPDFAVSDRKRISIEADLLTEIPSKGLPTAALRQFVGQLVSGLLLQLTSVPMELLATEWCFSRCPGLRQEQEIALFTNLREISGVLDPKIRSTVPKEIYDRSVAMNAAFAMNWAQLTGNQQAMLPYRVLGYVERGEKLLKHLNQIPRESLDLYSRAVDSWAGDLDMRDWYSWIYRES